MTPKRRQTKSYLIIVLVFFSFSSPIFGVVTAKTVVDNSPKITPLLAAIMKNTTASEKMPVVFQFSKDIPAEVIRDAILRYGDGNVIIRHVFHLIPMVSAFATKRAIQKIAELEIVTAITYDPKIKVADTIKPKRQPTQTTKYVHPDKLLGASNLWEQGYNGTGIRVAVLDSGAWGDHPDLQGKIVGFQDFINGLSDMDPSDGISSYDDNGHGTATAWLVAGTGTGNGVYSGMAPGADLLIVKILDETGATDDSIIAQGIEFAVDNNADVISLSVGGPWEDSNLVQPSVAASRAAVEQGVTVVIAAGNSGPAAETISVPGVTIEAITVGASAGVEGVVAFSSRGPVAKTKTTPAGVFAKPDLVAPGLEVFSGRWTDASDFDYPPYNSTQYGRIYTRFSGTSAAAPQVAGLVALLLDKFPGLPPLTTKAFLMGSATDLGQDAMAQGMGLVNVSRAAEMIEEYSRVITVMAPKRYPTLPTGSNVFIVGEDREPQNVTIVSTVSYPNAELQITGNASNYITLSTNTISIQTGYTYFGIGLVIPENLPLSAIGHYTGSINLVADSQTKASIEISLTITTFGGRLLIDMAHHSADDPDDPSYYSYFEEYLRGQGVTTAWLGSPENPISADIDALSQAEVFLIMDTELEYSTTEIRDIHRFVEEGGTLLVFSEFYDESTNTPAFAFDSYNEILKPFGIQCEKKSIGIGPDQQSGAIYGIGYGGIVENSSLTEGVEQLYILQGSTLSVNESIANAKGLFWIDSEKKHAIVATAEYGRGKVIVVSDGSTLYDTTIYDAIKNKADNLRLLWNIAGAIVPEMPRIYDVSIDAKVMGKTANVTAYIFDEDLVSVTMIIHSPNGENTTVPLQESLGYKYTTGYTFESGGFYKVSIVATDAKGNIRMFEKTVLVSVPLVDDAFVTTVVAALLIIVAIGLCYVAAIKFGIGKGRKRKGEEWEIPVTSDGPPAIV